MILCLVHAEALLLFSLATKLLRIYIVPTWYNIPKKF
nr:MAG TPA: hypothetical protein [Caudoviricetes sp.]